MGCGTSKKRKEESDDKGKREEKSEAGRNGTTAKFQSKVPTEGVQTPNLVPETEQPSMHVPRAEEGPCPACQGADPHKVHLLDCGHGLCATCAKKQLPIVMKGKDDEVTYQCRTCNSSKPLSKFHPVSATRVRTAELRLFGRGRNPR